MSYCPFVFMVTASVWHAVGLNVCLMLQFQYVMLLVYVCLYFYSFGMSCCRFIFVYPYSFIIACYWFMFYSAVSAWRAVGFRGFHSQSEVVELLDMQIHVLSALQDNYMYLVS